MSKIQWCDITQNPIYIRKEDGTNGGHWCAKKSEGCANCYSEEINQSGFFQFASHMAYTGKPPENLYFDESIVKSWTRARKPQKRFICSMTDLFGEWVPREWQFKVFDGATAAPTQTIQLLTKRPEVAVKAAQEWCIERDRLYLPENCWMGVSVENQARADERKDAWREMAVLVHPKNGVTWVSYEPALGCVDWDGWELINLMVIGGESGSKAREFHLDWGRKAIEWCQEWDIAPFVKQLGSNAVDSSLADIWGPEKKPLHHYTSPGILRSSSRLEPCQGIASQTTNSIGCCKTKRVETSTSFPKTCAFENSPKFKSPKFGQMKNKAVLAAPPLHLIHFRLKNG